MDSAAFREEAQGIDRESKHRKESGGSFHRGFYEVI